MSALLEYVQINFIGFIAFKLQNNCLKKRVKIKLIFKLWTEFEKCILKKRILELSAKHIPKKSRKSDDNSLQTQIIHENLIHVRLRFELNRLEKRFLLISFQRREVKLHFNAPHLKKSQEFRKVRKHFVIAVFIAEGFFYRLVSSSRNYFLEKSSKPLRKQKIKKIPRI